MRRLFFIGILVAAISSSAIADVVLYRNTGLSDAQLAVARSLSLVSLPKISPDPSNAVSDNPDAIGLGALLFNDTGMSADASVSCATCHLENRQF
jgi:cytochrome c peroxidase